MSVHKNAGSLGIGREAIEQAEKIVREAIEKDGVYETVEVRFFREYGALNLTVFIWKKDGVTLDDCEYAHNLVSGELDKIEDLFPDNYILNVSSQGLDRPIVTDDDFRRALNTEIEIITDKGKEHGILNAFGDEEITIIKGGKSPENKKILKKNITKVQPYIRF